MKLKTTLILLAIIVFISGAYYVWQNINLGFNKELLLRKRIAQYQDLLKVNHCIEVFNEFLSNHSVFKRENYAYGEYKTNADFFVSICSDESSKAENGQGHIKQFELGTVDIIVFKNRYSVDVHVKNAENSVQTWVYENGAWKRDL